MILNFFFITFVADLLNPYVMKFRSEEAMAAYSKKHHEAVEKEYKKHVLNPSDPKSKDKQYITGN